MNVMATKLLKHVIKKTTSDGCLPKEKHLSRLVGMIENDKGGYLAYRSAELLLKCKNKHMNSLKRVKSNLVVHSLMHRSKKFCDCLVEFEDFFKQPCSIKGKTECPRGFHFQFLGLKAKHYSQGVIRQSTFALKELPPIKKQILLNCNGETPWVVLDAVEGQIDVIISLDHYIRQQVANEKKTLKKPNSGNIESPISAQVIRSVLGTSNEPCYSTFTDHPLMQEIFRLMAIDFYSLVVLYETLISKFAKEYFDSTESNCQKFLERYWGYLDRIERMKLFRETLVNNTSLPAWQIFEFGCSVNLLPALEAHLYKQDSSMKTPSLSAPVLDSFDNQTLFFPPDTIERYVDSWPEPPTVHRVPDQNNKHSETPVYSTPEPENSNLMSLDPNYDDFTEVDLTDSPIDSEQDYQFSSFAGDESTDSQNEKLQESITFSSTKKPDKTDIWG